LDDEVIARYPETETPWIMIQLNLSRLLFWIGVRGHLFSLAFFAMTG
jgi:hypothetical protein